MNTPITLFDRVLDALKSCEGALSSYVDGNTYPDMMACVAIRDHALALIAEAEPANTLLPGSRVDYNAKGNDVLKANHDALKQAFVEFEELDPLPLEEAIAEAVQRDNADRITTGTHKAVEVPLDPKLVQELADAMEAERAAGASYVGEPVLKTYSVMLRRPCFAFTTVHVEAASAQEALRLGQDKAEDPPFPDWEHDSYDAVDWAHAEWSEIGQDGHEHADWEEPKLSPGALMAALHKIVQLTTEPYYDVAIVKIRNIALRAIDEAVPFEKE